MSYQELSYEERMQHAEEYALILGNEIKLEEQIIAELAATFYLSVQDAQIAFLRSKEKYKAQYNASKRRNMAYMFGLLVTGIIVSGFYFYVSAHNGFGFLSVLGIFFSLSVIGIISFFYRSIKGSIILKYPWLKSIKNNFFIESLPVPVFFLIFCCWSYFFGEILSEKNTFIKSYVLAQNVEKVVTTGKGASTYYRFVVEYNHKEFHFAKDDYRFGKDIYLLNYLKKGNPVTFKLPTAELTTLEDESWFNKNNRVVNILINDNWLVDFNNQNAWQKKRRKNYLFFASLIAMIYCYAVFHLFNKAKLQYEFAR